MLWGFRRPRKFCLPDAMRAPDVSPSSANSELARRDPAAGRPILDPRDGDAEDDVSSPKQKSLLAIAGSLLAEISLTKLLLAWIVVDRAAGGDPGPRAAHRDRMGRRRLFQSPGIVRNRRRAPAPRDRRRGLVRLASVVSRRRSQFLGAQRAGRSARIRLVPRGDPASGRTSLQARQRSGAGAHAGLELRRRRHPSRRRRGAGRGFCLARDAMDRIGARISRSRIS